ncbi:MAG: BON domain-containing protein [Calditrichaeota bacterium]|nr:BON domain-containing protein [Calditrichota bacterium]
MKRYSMPLRVLVVMMTVAFLFGAYQVTLAKTTNKQLEARVINAIARYYPQEFRITVTGDGVVKIEGQVNTLYDKYRIYDIVSRVRGVKDIENLLVVNTPTVPDDMIESNVIIELKRVGSILEPDRIKVHVDNGIVFLSGEVSYQREKIAAETVASWQEGVKGIVNNIVVLPPKKAVSDSNLRFIFSEIMKDQFPLEKNAKFTVKNGVVTLTGNCSTLYVKNMIEKEFKRVSGVKKIINNLKVVPLYD